MVIFLLPIFLLFFVCLYSSFTRYKLDIYSIFTRYKLDLLDRRNIEDITTIIHENMPPGIYDIYSKVLLGCFEE